ncbi:hypothetical protein POM88_047065 [Heracleum sosnowskyi]|uniref:hAT-like transposase RNase-H fold domain-containing protein n=1 Tax=Heracleum sosnowskyi TaxID=360622 RepID=A0AAD8H9T2_9APIA|nr:hypothetical protein POM88_047065 [Heracleum sosnowskyi]
MKDVALKKEMKKVGGDITNEEWKQVSSFLPFLKVFYDATLKLPGSLYITSNYYIDAIFGVGYVLFQHLYHEDEAIRKMASHMKLKYDKYWGDIDKLNHFIFISESLLEMEKFEEGTENLTVEQPMIIIDEQ